MKRFHSLIKVAWQATETKSTLLNFLPRRNYKFDSDVKWVKPVRNPMYYPEHTGDLEEVKMPDKNTIRLQFQDSEELKTASDDVKRVFSLQYLPSNHSYAVYRKQLVDLVRRNDHDHLSYEATIAQFTAFIRFNLPILKKDPKNVKLKIRVKRAIDKRRKILNLLRKLDYKKFEWILEKLNIVFKPIVDTDTRVTRRKSMMLLAQLRSEKLKEEKLGALKKSLDEAKVPFLEKKLAKLKWIKETEEKKGLSPTVTDADIQECIDKLEKVKVDIAKRAEYGYVRKIHPYFLEPFNEKLLIEKEQKNVCSKKNS